MSIEKIMDNLIDKPDNDLTNLLMMCQHHEYTSIFSKKREVDKLILVVGKIDNAFVNKTN